MRVCLCTFSVPVCVSVFVCMRYVFAGVGGWGLHYMCIEHLCSRVSAPNMNRCVAQVEEDMKEEVAEKCAESPVQLLVGEDVPWTSLQPVGDLGSGVVLYVNYVTVGTLYAPAPLLSV